MFRYLYTSILYNHMNIFSSHACTFEERSCSFDFFTWNKSSMIAFEPDCWSSCSRQRLKTSMLMAHSYNYYMSLLYLDNKRGGTVEPLYHYLYKLLQEVTVNGTFHEVHPWFFLPTGDWDLVEVGSLQSVGGKPWTQCRSDKKTTFRS